MNVDDFRRIALSLPGAELGCHHGATDFRVGGKIFATLAHARLGYGNLFLAPQQQADFISEAPDVFIPIAGGWGRMGYTHIILDRASEEVLEGALRTAWQLRVSRNERAGRKPKMRKAAGPPR